ncbi:MAG: hypothetical protein IJ496_09705 [Ruminococcus sp.]|nr:hypothetical protein [Ruminococcus sp.]
MSRILYILVQCTWGFPQTLLGGIIFLLNRHSRPYLYHGAVVSHWRSHLSASIGPFVFISRQHVSSRRLLVHEYGHTLQSLLLGPLYLPLIGLPSMLWMLLPCFRKMRRKRHISYYSFYTESWANRWGEKICGEAAMGLAHID